MKQILMRMIMVSGVVLVSGLLAAGQSRGSSPAPITPSNGTPGGESPDVIQQQQNAISGRTQDRDFLESAIEGGTAEVEMGQLAVQKGSSDDVKQFGQKMVQDHTQLDNQLKQVAQQVDVDEPKGLSKKDQGRLAKLNELSGAQFDEAYIQLMVKEHKRDLSDFKAEAQDSPNPAVKQVAQQGSPIIDQHLQMIEQIAKSHNEHASK